MLRRTFEALTVKLTDDQIRAEMQGQLEGCERLAVEIFRRAVSALPEGPPENARINPYGIGLDPARWDADGLVAVAVGSV
jgi:hypothetical protein